MIRRRQRLALVTSGACLLVATACSDGTTPGLAFLETYQGDQSDTSLLVSGIHGACDEILPATVEETSTEVRIRVPLAEEQVDTCPAMGVGLTVPVTLEAPLGGRRVVDDARNMTLQQCRKASASSSSSPASGLCPR